MSARHKLNAMNFCGVLVVAGIVGLVTDSGWAFIIAALGLLIAALGSGDIRLR